MEAGVGDESHGKMTQILTTGFAVSLSRPLPEHAFLIPIDLQRRKRLLYGTRLTDAASEVPKNTRHGGRVLYDRANLSR